MSTYTTRSGRAIKKPLLYEPDEKIEDDFTDSDDDYDSESDVSDHDSDLSDDEDADDNGNLKGFVVDEDEEDEEDDDSSVAE